MRGAIRAFESPRRHRQTVLIVAKGNSVAFRVGGGVIIMRIEQLRDFLVFAKYLNYTHAAQELHMSPANLSKHIKQLEREAGFELVATHGNKTCITKTGNLFLGRLPGILRLLDNLIEECRVVQSGSRNPIFFQEPPFSDDASRHLYRSISRFKEQHPMADVRFTQIHRRDAFECLRSGKVDVMLGYRGGSLSDSMEYYRAKGFDCAWLQSESLEIWCAAGHPLRALGRPVVLGDLRDCQIMTPSDSYSPIRNAIVALCRETGFEANLHYASTTLKSEYLYASPPQAVYLVPEGGKRDARMLAREDMVFLPLSDAALEVFIVWNEPVQDAVVRSFLELVQSEGK